MNEKQNRKESFGKGKLSLLDKIIYKLRVNSIRKYCEFAREKNIMDVGCGYNGVFLRYIQDRYKPRKCIAYDLSLNKELLSKHEIIAIEGDLNKPLLLNEKVDVIFATAILEHLSHPVEFLQQCYEHLVEGGHLLLTTPSVWSQPVLEFLSYKLHVISAVEIADHKDYYDKKKLIEYLVRGGFSHESIHHEYFELGMNNLIVAKK